MTNPNNAIGVNAAYGTRTSVNAMNDLAQIVGGRGILSGWAVVPKSGMTVSAGGVAGTRDVAIGEDNLGNRICLNNRLASSVDVVIPAASASSARYDAIVVYANNPAQAEDTTPDAPSVCGIIVASGSASGVSDAQIRSAITADGGTGSTAYYAVLAQVYVGAGATVITSANISQSRLSFDPADGSITTAKIADEAVTSQKIDWTTFGKASVAVLTASTGSFTAASKGVLMIDSQFQANTANTDAKATITFTGASGGTFSPRAGQFGVANTRSHVFGFAFVEAGDTVDFTVNYTNAALPAWGSDNGFALFLPCEW